MSERIDELDGWRGISIGCVILGHLTNFALLPAGSDPHASPGSWLSHIDTLGVQIFFCISGFIITRLALAERARTGDFSIGRFWIRRTFRIVPAQALYLGVVVLLHLDGRIEQQWGQTLRGAAFVCNLPGFDDCGWFTGHLWSLAVEEQFYLLFPLLFATLAPRRLAVLVAAAWLALVAWPTLSALAGIGGRGLFFRPFTYLLAGVLLAMFERETRARLAPIARPAWWASIAVMAAALVILGAAPAGDPGPALRQVLWLLVPVAVCTAIALSIDSGGPLGAFIRQPWLVLIGRMSYSLYLWQQLWLGRPDLYADGSWLPTVALLPLTAWLSWRWIERPFARQGARLAGSPATASP